MMCWLIGSTPDCQGSGPGIASEINSVNSQGRDTEFPLRQQKVTKEPVAYRYRIRTFISPDPTFRIFRETVKR